MGPFDDPAVAAKPVFGLDATTSDARLDAPGLTTAATTWVVVSFVSM
jgi:hypothetical protein